MESVVRTYGKLLIFGSYAILEPGNIGLVVNVDKGTTTKIEETKEGQLVLDMKNFDISVSGTVAGHRISLKKEQDTVRFIKNAIESSFKYIKQKGVKIKDIKVTSINDPELYITRKMKTGFGSSATSTVGAVAAVLGLHGIDDRKIVYRIAKYSHYRSQGDVGSGFDISAACFGSHFFMAEDDDMSNFIGFVQSEQNLLKEEFYWPQTLLPVVVFTGKSASTEKLIRKVKAYKKRNPAKYQKMIHNYNLVNIECKKAFELNDLRLIKKYLEMSWTYRRKFGETVKANIEPEGLTKLITKLKLNGAYLAGLLGAGGGDSILALCLNKQDQAALIEYAESNNMVVFDNVSITNDGYDIK